ncbi:MAG: hypothetical protein Q9227_008264 [Pyrenula ochraceoflavens]
MFYASPRNHLNIQIQLLDRLNCNVLATPDHLSETSEKVFAMKKMRKLNLPDLDFFLQDGKVRPYPYEKTWEEARKDPYVVMHSSGTTGIPKVLILKNGTVAAHDAFQRFSEFNETQWYGQKWAGKRVATSFPWVHAGGVLLLACSIYYSFSIVIANTWPLSGAIADWIHVNGRVRAAWYSPSVLVDIARSSEYLENISKLDNVSYAGGILPRHVGDAINKCTHLFGTFASTETGILPGEIPPSHDWGYYRYNKRLGHTFRHFAEDMYELVHTRNPAMEDFQGVFYTFLDTDTYSMRDLYIAHPTLEGWWRSAGRIDDVVVFADAKKLNPIPYEAAIEQHPAVATALICGTGRSRPAVLLQPREWPKDRAAEQKLLDEVWSTTSSFDKINGAGPVNGRLIRELAVVTRAEKPMARAGGKDTVQRKRSIELYEKEIEEAYERAEKMGLLWGDIANQGNLV